MTKHEFLDELGRHAGALSDGERARLMEYYAEMIDDRMEEGLPETEAVAALGEPQELLAALAPVSQESDTSAPETVAALTNLRVKVAGADVVIRRQSLANGAAAQLRFSDPSRFSWRMVDDTLEVTQPEPDGPKFSLRWIQQMIAAPAQHVTIILSDGLSGALDFEGGGSDLSVEGLSFAKAQLITASGDIELKDVHSEGGIGIDLRTHSGDIKLTDTRAANLLISAASGDISAKGLALKGRLRLETASGDVVLRGLDSAGTSITTASGDIEIHRGRAGETAIRAASGDVELDELECDPTLSVETANGDIKLSRCIARETRLKAASGDVDLRLVALPCGYDISAHTASGSVSLPKDNPPARDGVLQPKITIQTASGDIEARLVAE